MPIHEFDPFKKTGLTITNSNARDSALKAIAEYVKEQCLSYIGDGSSPIQGGKWKRSLSPQYKEKKAEISSVDFSNLELYGDMLDALKAETSSDTKIKYGVEGPQADKADGNNRGTYGSLRGNRSKAREFIPKAGQTFKNDIWAGIKEIIEGYGGTED